jgi:hypothetical protein
MFADLQRTNHAGRLIITLADVLEGDSPVYGDIVMLDDGDGMECEAKVISIGYDKLVEVEVDWNTRRLKV